MTTSIEKGCAGSRPAGQTTRLGRREDVGTVGVDGSAPCHHRRRWANLTSGSPSLAGRSSVEVLQHPDEVGRVATQVRVVRADQRPTPTATFASTASTWRGHPASCASTRAPRRCRRPQRERRSGDPRRVAPTRRGPASRASARRRPGQHHRQQYPVFVDADTDNTAARQVRGHEPRTARVQPGHGRTRERGRCHRVDVEDLLGRHAAAASHSTRRSRLLSGRRWAGGCRSPTRSPPSPPGPSSPRPPR